MRRIIGGGMLGLAALSALSCLFSLMTTGDFGAFIISLIFPAMLAVLGWWVGNFSVSAGGNNFGGTTEDQARLQRDQAVAVARQRREELVDQQRAELAEMRAEMRRAAEARNRELGL